MPDPLGRFVSACQAVNPVAAGLAYPPFTTGLRQETPLNSSPYVYRVDELDAEFGGSPRRRILVATLVERLEALERAGIRTEMLLLGGSFLRRDREPGDIDGLLVYSIDPAVEPSPRDAMLAQFTREPRRDDVDLRLCPADCHPLVLVKRTIFFSNLFSYDRESKGLERGIVLVLPSSPAGEMDG
jgi:hypothetical protein